MDKEHYRNYQKKYKRRYVRNFVISISRLTHQEIIDWLESKDNVTEYIRRLIWADMVEKGGISE